LKALHAKIGELTVENDFLEGALTKAGMLSAKRYRPHARSFNFRAGEGFEHQPGAAYYNPRPVSAEDLAIMRRLDELHLEHPFMGARMLRDMLNREGVSIGRRHVATLMKRMGIEAIYRRPNTSKPAPGTRFILSSAQTEDRQAQPCLGDGHQCATASGVGDEGRSLAIGLQEQVANHRERRGSKARVVSVAEKAPRGVRCGTGRRTQVNCRSSVESAQTTSKAGSDVAPRLVWTGPAYGPDGVRHRAAPACFGLLR